MEVDKGQKTTVEGMIYIISIKLTQKKEEKIRCGEKIFVQCMTDAAPTVQQNFTKKAHCA